MVTYREETNIVEKFLNLLSALYFFIISFHKKFKKGVILILPHLFLFLFFLNKERSPQRLSLDTSHRACCISAGLGTGNQKYGPSEVKI